MVYKNKIFLVFLILLASQKLLANDLVPSDAIDPFCKKNSEYIDSKNLKIDSLNIKIKKNRQWVKNLFNLHHLVEQKKYESEHTNWISDFKIKEKYKKNFDANIYVKFQGIKECKFKAKVRITGDLWWHLAWKNGSPISSLKIRLIDGNINNVTRFKLYLKKARNGENEIFVANLFKELGFISPKTFLLNARINNVNNDYIFQEDISKELIESSSHKEGPVLEGDERFTISLLNEERKKYANINYAKVSNKNFPNKNNGNSITSLEALSNLNKLFLHNHQYKIKKKITDPASERFYLFTEKFFSKENDEILETFEALSFALDTQHSLSADDRRFYYNSINKFYLPIYYDGKSHILDKKQVNKFENFSRESVLGAKKAITIIEKLDLKEFHIKLKSTGVNITFSKLSSIINKIISRLKSLEKSNYVKLNFKESNDFFDEYYKQKKNIRFIFSDFNKKQIFQCETELENCKTLNTNENEFYEILNQSVNQDFTILKNKTNAIDNMVFIFDNINIDKGYFSFLDNNWETLNDLKSTKIEFINSSIKINEDSKTINIYQLKEDGKVLFNGGNLENWNINFYGVTKNNDKLVINSVFNSKNLSGCVNFYDVNFISTSIFSKDSNCEDSINIIRSKGDLQNILIENSISDSLDVDFSNIFFNKIKVIDSKNDCLDFSYGTYIINKADLNYCGDKAISVGEKSDMKITEINIDNSFIGIASKDSSVTEIFNGNILSSDVCLTAYRKKVEFSGSKLILHNIDCENEVYYYSKDSKVIFN